MVDLDYCLSQITNKKQKIIRGIVAADQALKVARVLCLAYRHATTPHGDQEISQQTTQFPSYYRSIIEGSSVSDSGRIAIPGLFKLLDIITDQIHIMVSSAGIEYSFLIPDMSEKKNQLISRMNILKQLDFTFDTPELQTFMQEEEEETDTLGFKLYTYRMNLNSLLDWYSPSIVYGAYCYHLESVDRFMVRSFMQGARKESATERSSDYPVTLIIRENNDLIIGYFLDETEEKMFKIEIKGLNIMVNLYGTFPPYLTNTSGFTPPFTMIWRRNSCLSHNQSEDLNEKFPLVTGSFQARSSDEAMQFLSDLGYQIRYHFPEFSFCGKIAG